MTGPRVDARDTLSLPRVLSLEEFEQAQGMSLKGMKESPFPAQPPAWKPDAAGRMGALLDGMQGAAPRDVTRTPADPVTSGKPITSKVIGPLARQVVNPVLEHPWMTAGVLGATMVPVVGPIVNGALMGDMASNVALYGYQRHLEKAATPGARAIMEADPERISGEAAAVQGLMLGLIPAAYFGAKGVRALDVSKGMVEAGATGVKELTPAELFPESPATPRGDNTYLNKRFAARLEADAKRQGSPRDVEPLPGLEASGDQARLTVQPRHPSGYSVDNPFAPELVRGKALATETPAEGLAASAAAKNDPMRPRKRILETAGIDTARVHESLRALGYIR